LTNNQVRINVLLPIYIIFDDPTQYIIQ